MEELRFDGKSVIITGAGRGFGRQHALLLASRGARLVIADWGMELNGLGSSPDPIEQVAKEIDAAGGEAIPLHIDVADEENAKTVVQTALDAYGKLDVLVNNAGISDPDWFDDQTAERIERMTRNQYYSVVWMSKAAWPHLKASGGNIVNTASEAVLGNVPKAASYCGAKGGVFAFSRALALDGMQFGVRVNAICPRGNTRLSAPEVLAFHFDRPLEEFINNPFLDAMLPEYVSPAVAFFAHESCQLTGETFICGGLKVMRLAVFETQGITLEGNITPEDIVANLDAVMELKDATYMPIAMFND